MVGQLKLEVMDKDATHIVIELFGGDNNLNAFVQKDLEEMNRGKGDLITILALVDRAGAGNSQVWEISPRTGVQCIKKMGEIDTGNPNILSDFVAAALMAYPKAQHRVLGFWDHGTGVFDEQDPGNKAPMSGGYQPQKSVRGAAKRLFFRNKAALPERERAMLHDDTDGGVLTNKEASTVLERALRVSGLADKNTKFNMIFSDTCLNGMVEVLTQFAPYADVITGSEELEPGDGWNYETWFKKLAQNPPKNGMDWGKAAVDSYGEHYEKLVTEHPVTLAAFRTDIDLIGPFKQVVNALLPLGKNGFRSLQFVRSQCQAFAKRNTYDLRDFAEKLQDELKDETGVASACQALIQAFDAARIASVRWGKRVENARGLALWIPNDRWAYQDVASTYRELDFGKRSGWTEYLAPFFA